MSWWVLAQLTSPARTPHALHVLNIALHGVNAALVWVVARRLVASPGIPFAAAGLFLVMPISVEPVAWGSGVFDVMLTTFALILAGVATSRRDLRVWDQVLCLLLTMMMIATKETGVIAGPLVLLLYWVRWARISRRALVTAAAQLVLAGSYTLARELTDRLDHRLLPRLDVALAWRLVSGTARAFVVPLHQDVIRAHPVIALACVTGMTLVLAAWAFRCRHSPTTARLAALAVLGTGLCVAPAIRLFGITPDLQGTRYVYLASAWWSIALASALLDGWTARRMQLAATTITVIAVGAGVVATRVHLQSWTAARIQRDRILQALVALPVTCQEASATGAIDNVSGAYVFRNGLNEALATLGRSFQWVEPAQAAAECRVTLER
jgi:hypothetical protein